MKHQTYVSAVVYVADDPDTVADFLAALDAHFTESFAYHEIVVVVEVGTDTAAAAVQRFGAASDAPVTVLELARSHGVEAGIVAGLDRAVGDFIFELEGPRADYPLDLLDELYVTCASGIDIVAASSTRLSRRSRWFYRFANRVSGLNTPLGTERVRVVSRRALTAMLGLKEKVRYRKALYALTGLPRRTVHYEPVAQDVRAPPRQVNRETITLAFDILLSFSAIGLRVAFVLSLAFVAFSVAVLVYTVVTYLLAHDVVEGWTTIMGIVSLGFAGLFFILGIIGEYVARILVEVRGRPVYVLRKATVHPSQRLDERSKKALIGGSSFVARQHAAWGGPEVDPDEEGPGAETTSS